MTKSFSGLQNLLIEWEFVRLSETGVGQTLTRAGVLSCLLFLFLYKNGLII